MWALGYDGTRPELYKALSDKFLRDTTLPEAGIKMLPAAAGDEGFVVSWTGRDDVGVTSYDVEVAVDGGAWTTWHTGMTATSAVWLGLEPARWTSTARLIVPGVAPLRSSGMATVVQENPVADAQGLSEGALARAAGAVARQAVNSSTARAAVGERLCILGAHVSSPRSPRRR